jgi:hypothetical protein
MPLHLDMKSIGGRNTDHVKFHKQVIHIISQESEEALDPRSTPGLALYSGLTCFACHRQGFGMEFS